jgi:hypothetical protein
MLSAFQHRPPEKFGRTGFQETGLALRFMRTNLQGGKTIFEQGTL